MLTAIGAVAAPKDDTIAIIVNRSSPVKELGEREIKQIYTNAILRWPEENTPIVIFDLSISDPVRRKFSNAVIGRSPEKVAEDWAHLKITNQAVNPPITLKSQRLIIKRVALKKGAIGYVAKRMIEKDDKVRIVLTIK